MKVEDQIANLGNIQDIYIQQYNLEFWAEWDRAVIEAMLAEVADGD